MIDARTDRSGVATDLRRRSIIDAAVAVFAERGYGGSSTRQVAERCGLKQGHLYYYFPAKQDILYDIVAELHDSFLDGIDQWEAAATGGAVQTLRAVLYGHVMLLCRRHRETFVSYENFRFLDSKRQRVIIDNRARYEEHLRRLIECCGPRRLAVPEDIVTKAVLGIVNWPYEWYSPKGPHSAHDLSTWLADLGISSLALAGLDEQP